MGLISYTRLFRPGFLLLIAGALYALPALAARTAPPVSPQTKIAPEVMDLLLQNDAKTARRVIVELIDPFAATGRPAGMFGDGTSESKSSPKRTAELDRRKDALLAELGGKGGLSFKLRHRYPRFRLLAFEADDATVRALAASPLVKRVHPNRLHRPSLETSLPFIGADVLHGQGHGGAGTAVAVLDTPVRYWNGEFGDCPEPGADGCSIAVWENFVDQPAEEVARSSHGTNVSGIVLGVAPETKVLSLNVFRWTETMEQPGAYDEDILAALDWTAAHAGEYNIVAVNMSLGHERTNSNPCNDEAEFDAFRTLYDEYGIVSAVASGNESTMNSLGGPACINLAVSVGAQFDTELGLFMLYPCNDQNRDPFVGGIACFTNINGQLDTVAPGVWIDAGGIDDMGGTSMAAPHVAGAVALLHAYWNDDRDAYWTEKSMKVAGKRLPYGETAFGALNLDPARFPDWDRAAAFESFYAEDDAALIPRGDPLTFTVAVDGVEESRPAYLILEYRHPDPEDVEVTLTAPSGASVTFSPPRALSNFNGVIGREFAPGLLDAFSTGENGTWTLGLSDTGRADRGNYFNATLFFTPIDCADACGALECGDDGCGGECGPCAEGFDCGFSQECLYPGDTCKGDSCEGAVEIPVADGLYHGSTIGCSNYYSAACGGLLAAEKIYTFTAERNTHFFAESNGFNTATYLRKNGCADADGERLCNDQHDDLPDGGSRIEGELTPGTYYLFVDSTFDSGDFDLEVRMCAPDCRNRNCGDDGCGDPCGECANGELCLEGVCCLPSCEGLECGDDGCGGSCGECDAGEDCAEGLCEVPPEPDGDEESADVPADGDEAPDADGDETSGNGQTGGSGCAAFPAASAGLWPLLLVPILRRRRHPNFRKDRP